MTITRHSPSKMYSAAVEHSNTVYVAGQVADDTSQDVRGQTSQVLAKIDAILAQAGTSKSKLLWANVWLADLRGYDQMNESWLAWVDKDNLPARATVEAKLARASMLVEIAVICAK
jgi:enamine deaminase RidA (YjgF/YER057c/UK114 family)